MDVLAPERMQMPKMGPHPEKKDKQKICGICGAPYLGTGFSKYCPEHRGIRKPTKSKPKDDNIFSDSNPNQVIIHKLFRSEDQTHECACSHVPFTIRVIPGVFVYPKYCKTHRNEYQRNLYNVTTLNLKLSGVATSFAIPEPEVIEIDSEDCVIDLGEINA